MKLQFFSFFLFLSGLVLADESGLFVDSSVLYCRKPCLEAHLSAKIPIIVLFFAGWWYVHIADVIVVSPHCQAYIPKYKGYGDELYEENSNALLLAVSCPDDKELCKEYNIHGYPTLKAFSFTAIADSLTSQGFEIPTRSDLFQWVSASTAEADVSIDMAPNMAHHESAITINPVVADPSFDHLSDALNALIISLNNHVGNVAGKPTDNQRTRINRMIALVIDVLPDSSSVQYLTNIQVKSIQMSQFSQLSDAVISSPYPSSRVIGWHSCGDYNHVGLSSISDLNESGFLCGFWTLLHLLTIGMANDSYKYHGVIRDYIEEYFPCHDCRDHFLATYDASLIDDEIVKLWTIHNEVNKRKKISTWPSDLDCPSCPGNVEAVKKYLTDFYWPTSQYSFLITLFIMLAVGMALLLACKLLVRFCLKKTKL